MTFDSSTQTVALTDNDLIHHSAADAALRSAGYEVFTAEDGVAGLEFIREKRPPFVVLERSLPKLHGFAVCQEIRNDPTLRRACQLPVLQQQRYSHYQPLLPTASRDSLPAGRNSLSLMKADQAAD